MAAWREPAVSEATWERVEPHLEALDPGDDFRIFEAARQIHVEGSQRAARPIVVIPSWITSLSGGAAGGLSMFGQLVGRDGDRIRGSHVFGTVTEERIHPRYQVFTQAVEIEREEFDALLGAGAQGVGQLPQMGGMLYFRDLMIVGTRRLAFQEAPAAPREPALPSVTSRAEFRAIEPVLDALPEGTDLFTLLALLGAVFVTEDFGETHSLLVPGFLHTRAVRTQTVSGTTGIFKMRPFGWVTDDRELIDRIAIFQNDRLLRMVPHRGLEDWSGYLEMR